MMGHVRPEKEAPTPAWKGGCPQATGATVNRIATIDHRTESVKLGVPAPRCPLRF